MVEAFVIRFVAMVVGIVDASIEVFATIASLAVTIAIDMPIIIGITAFIVIVTAVDHNIVAVTNTFIIDLTEHVLHIVEPWLVIMDHIATAWVTANIAATFTF